VRPIAVLGVLLAIAASSSSALASATSRLRGGGDSILDDVGRDWQPTTCPPDVVGLNLPEKCFSDAQSDAEIQIYAMEVPPGIRARDFVELLARSQPGTAFPIDGLPTAHAYEVDVGTGSRTLLLVVPGRKHVFSIWLTDADQVRPDPVPFLVELGGRQQAREGVSRRSARATPAERELEKMLVSAPPGLGLEEIPLSTVPTGLKGLRAIARSDRIIDVLKERQTTRVRAFVAPTVFAVVELDRMPFDEFAAVGLGTVLRRGDRSALPGLGRVPGAVAVRPAPDQVMVVFRRGPYLVTIGSNSDEAALYFARRQAARLPAGDSGPYFFPSTARAIATVVALTTGLCLVVVGLSRVRAHRFRLRTVASGEAADGRAESESSAIRPDAHADDVSMDARHLRRMGVSLIAVQIVAVNLLVLGICALLDVFRGLSPWVAIGLLVVGLGGGLWFTNWQRRRELEAIGPETGGWRPSVPAPAGALIGAVAVALLISGMALLAYAAADLAFGSSLRTLERAASLHIDPGQLSGALLVVGLLLIAIGGVAFRFARMRARAHAEELRQQDRRPAILYLRSFEDDQLSVATVLSARRPFFELFRVRGTDPFEETITWELAPYGPVIAVGRPGRSLASLGAAREYLPQDRWQEDVAELMHDSRAIVMTIGATEGLRWEVQRVAAQQYVGKTIFVVPPLDEATLRQRWHFTADALHGAGVDAPPLPDDVANVLTAVLVPSATWRVTVADTRDEATYRAAIDRSVRWLTDSTSVESSTSAPG
jgi:F0F1-type ATP synthase assembly protein I